MSLLIIFAIVFYLIASGVQIARLNAYEKFAKRFLLIAGFIAVILHAELLHRWIDLPMGQNLSSGNLFSMAVWLAAFLLSIAALRKPIENLCLIIYPLAALSIILNLLFPHYYVLETSDADVFHILLAIITFSVLCIAALQAIFLILQEYLLKHQSLLRWMLLLPPLQAMEQLLFRMIALGFILLTVLAISSIISFGNIFAANLIAKTSIVLLAWLVFLILLIGRYYLGWRGKIAIRFTLIGVILLAIVYYGTRVLVYT